MSHTRYRSAAISCCPLVWKSDASLAPALRLDRGPNEDDDFESLFNDEDSNDRRFESLMPTSTSNLASQEQHYSCATQHSAILTCLAPARAAHWVRCDGVLVEARAGTQVIYGPMPI